jgi:uncharacterized protein (DUF885 family)
VKFSQFSILLCLTSCVKKPTTSEILPALNEAAVNGVENKEFRVLLHDHWEKTMESSPIWATMLGDHRWDDRIADQSLAAQERSRAEQESWLKRAEAINPQELSTDEKRTHALFVHKVQTDLRLPL